jgi:acyl dehydratase
MHARPHERFSVEVDLSSEAISTFAAAAGDRNPLHHDAIYARATRFGRVFASGSQTTSLLMGLTASHFAARGAMVGLDFWFRFIRPVFADQRVKVEWLVVRVDPTAHGSGAIVDMRGRLRTQDGKTAVGAKGRVPVAADL